MSDVAFLQAIETKRTPSGRIKATSASGESVTVPYEFDGNGSHITAAKKLCVKLNWHGRCRCVNPQFSLSSRRTRSS